MKNRQAPRRTRRTSSKRTSTDNTNPPTRTARRSKRRPRANDDLLGDNLRPMTEETDEDNGCGVSEIPSDECEGED